jgi:hypothetical protein
MKADTSLPDILDRVTPLDAPRVLRELQHKLEKLIARHHQEQKSKPVRRSATSRKRLS